MLSKKIQDAFNNQLNEEYYSSYLYLSMAAYLETKNLSGMANWMLKQSEEEMEHAMKFFSYIVERGGIVELKQIKAPKKTWKNPLDVFQESFAHEQHITGEISKLVELVQKEKDHAAGIFLQWFVTEQVEEESTVENILDQLKMVGDKDVGLFMIDRQLGQRQ